MTRAARAADKSGHGHGLPQTKLRRRQRARAKQRERKAAEKDRERMTWLQGAGHVTSVLREAWMLRFGHEVPSDIRQVVDDLMGPKP